MLKRPLILGNKGGMGRRYSAILKHIGVECLGADIGEDIPGGFDSVIICTPTHRHIQDVRWASDFNVPILCEKPLATNLCEALDACDEAEAAGLKLRMVNQYSHLAFSDSEQDTLYNYFRTGSDGVAWDCISILALANGLVELGNDSPYWLCVINGQQLSLSDMDMAYVTMIKGWLKDPSGDIPYIRDAHVKVFQYLEATTCLRS